jgi:hypothetical protein
MLKHGMRLLAGAVASFPIKGLPFTPIHGPQEPLLSGFLLSDSALSSRHVFRPRAIDSARRFTVSPQEPIVIRLQSQGPAAFFLGEDPLTFQNELCIDVSCVLGIVPGAEALDSTYCIADDVCQQAR